MASKSEERTAGLALAPAGLALGITLVAGYVVCWLVAVITPFASGFTHAWLNLFSALPLGSRDQLVEGILFSAVAGWFAALIFVPTYNLIARADRII
ncbi:MAG TPA: hypothetical protein VG735_15090 [Caulobacterales bacterium]|nr:hypothetical protein [Caulobacterales bacterium]